MNLFNGLARSLQEGVAEATKSATVQHILVQTENEALDIRKKIANDGLESFGKYAQQVIKWNAQKKEGALCDIEPSATDSDFVPMVSLTIIIPITYDSSANVVQQRRGPTPSLRS